MVASARATLPNGWIYFYNQDDDEDQEGLPVRILFTRSLCRPGLLPVPVSKLTGVGAAFLEPYVDADRLVGTLRLLALDLQLRSSPGSLAPRFVPLPQTLGLSIERRGCLRTEAFLVGDAVHSLASWTMSRAVRNVGLGSTDDFESSLSPGPIVSPLVCSKRPILVEHCGRPGHLRRAWGSVQRAH